jgi:hypothetical protein
VRCWPVSGACSAGATKARQDWARRARSRRIAIDHWRDVRTDWRTAVDGGSTFCMVVVPTTASNQEPDQGEQGDNPMTAQSLAGRHLRARLIEDNPGQHVYRFACVRCDRECGPEFTVSHVSSEAESEAVPVVVAECECWPEAKNRRPAAFSEKVSRTHRAAVA